MKQRYIYIPLVAGVFTPPLVHFAVQRYVGISPASNVWSLFTIMLALVPFAALTVVAWWISSFDIKARRRLECIFWGGFLSVWAFTIYGHWTVWYPIYALGERMRSTFAIVFLFIPFYALFFLAMGLLVGWGISFLPPFQESRRQS
jgi:hypothetical protein